MSNKRKSKTSTKSRRKSKRKSKSRKAKSRKTKRKSRKTKRKVKSRKSKRKVKSKSRKTKRKVKSTRKSKRKVKSKSRKTKRKSRKTKRKVKSTRKTVRQPTRTVSQKKQKKQENKVIKGLSWVGNSCYIDSVFVSLFAAPNNFVDENILNKELKIDPINSMFKCNNDSKEDLQTRQNIQEELRQLVEKIRNPKGVDSINCTNFRNLIKRCKTSNKNLKFYSTRTQDPVEFLEYLCNIFNINFNASFNELPIGYLSISYPEFKVYTFDRRVHRKASWTPPMTLNNLNLNLNLNAVVTHTPGHYTCFFRLKNVWYFYNDYPKPVIKHIGSYNELLKHSQINVKTNGVLYFYTI